MKNVVVFGGSGFIGSHVIDLLLKDYFVINFDLKSYTPKVNNYKQYFFDIRNAYGICNILVDIKPFFVYQFAGIANIEKCISNPVNAVKYNIVPTVEIINAICNLDIPIPKFIYASSAYVHNTNSGPYGICKRACEDLIKFYSDEYCCIYSILRYGTIYGPRAGKDNSIRQLIEHALKTKKISYYGSGNEIREYIHVKDVAKISVDVLDHKYDNQTLMLTGMNPIKASDMLEALRDILGNDYEIEYRNEDRAGHYKVTPYKYQPDIAQKIIPDTCYDLGAGLLSVVEELSLK